MLIHIRLFFILISFFFFSKAQAESKYTLINKAKDLLSKEEVSVIVNKYKKENNINEKNQLIAHISHRAPFFLLYQQEENKPLRFLKAFGLDGKKLQYKIDEKIYPVTEYDLSLTPPNKLLYEYGQLQEFPNYTTHRSLTLALEEASQKLIHDDFTSPWSNPLKTLAKGDKIPLITREQLAKTNNMTLYLSYLYNEKGEATRLTISPISGTEIGGVKHGYGKKINLIKDYQTIGKQLFNMQMTEVKGKFAITEMEAHFALMLQKDTEIIYPLYFCNYRKDEWVIVNFDTRKVYLLNEKHNDTFVELLQSLLIRKEAEKIDFRYGK